VTLSCGDSICQKHVQELMQFNTVECPSCCDFSQVPEKGFKINTTIEYLLQVEFDQSEWGENFKAARDECDKLRKLVSEISPLKNDQHFLVNMHFSALRNKVNFKREKLKIKVDQVANKMIQDLNKTEN